jgi:hypothetical protein
MKKVYVVLVGGGVEAVFDHDLELIKEFFLLHHNAKDMNFDELFSYKETEYQFYINKGIQKVEIHEQYVFKKVNDKTLERSMLC